MLAIGCSSPQRCEVCQCRCPLFFSNTSPGRVCGMVFFFFFFLTISHVDFVGREDVFIFSLYSVYFFFLFLKIGGLIFFCKRKIDLPLFFFSFFVEEEREAFLCSFFFLLMEGLKIDCLVMLG